MYVFTSPGNFGLGRNFGGTDGLNGTLDEVAIYNRELSYGDVLDLYKEGNGITWTGLTTITTTKTTTGLSRVAKTILQTISGLLAFVLQMDNCHLTPALAMS